MTGISHQEYRKMLDRKLLESLGGWQGYRVDRVAWLEEVSWAHTVNLFEARG